MLVSITLPVLVAHDSTAASADWITANLALKEQKTYNLPQDAIDVSEITGNKIPCLTEKFKIKPELKNATIVTQLEQKTSVCSYSVAVGRFGGGYLQKNGTTIAGQLKGTMSTSSYLVPIPGSSIVLGLISAGGIAYKMYIIDDAYTAMSTAVNSSTNAVTYTLASPTSQYIKNSRGDPLYVDVNTYAISDNGQWLLIDGLNSGFVRINLNTHQVLPFASALSSTNGGTVYSMNAISSDGTEAVISSLAPTQRFDYYDLSSCHAPATGMIYTCSVRNIQNSVKQKVPSYFGGTNRVGFINNELLEFYGSYDYVNTNNRKIGLFTLSVNGESYTKVNYLALGDSFSSGEGVKNYRPGTDFADNRCHQSVDSYPYLLHSLLSNTGTFQDIACSGAKTKDVVIADRKTYIKAGVQAHNKDLENFDNEIFTNYLPGYRGQINFVDKNKPQIITMSMGGNDIGFTNILTKCVLASSVSCYHSYEDRQEIVANINSQYSRFLQMYQTLKKSAAPGAKVYIIGYPQIAKVNGNCANNVHFSNEEIIFGSQLINYLNSIIKLAADHAGVFYVDVEDAFAGHRLCEPIDEWNIAVNGLTAGNGGPVSGVGPIANESYHPNALGHKLFTSVIAGKTNNFTASMPASITTDPVFRKEEEISLFANAPKEYRAVWQTTYSNNITDDVVYQNAPNILRIDASQYGLKPSSDFNLALYSDPTNLGTITSDSVGDITASYTIPPIVKPGFHTLHVRGKNIVNESVDLEKIVYVAASIDDYDGDGISNSNEKCATVEPMNIDKDKDGTDDACDDFIDKAPTELPLSPTEKPENSEPSLDQTLPSNPDPTITNPSTSEAEQPSIVPDYKINDAETLPLQIEQPTSLATVKTNTTLALYQSDGPQISQPHSQPLITVQDSLVGTESQSSSPTTIVAGISSKSQPQKIANHTQKRLNKNILLAGTFAALLFISAALGIWRHQNKTYR